MWFKKQKTFYTELVSPDEEVLVVSGIPVELQWAFRWIGNALSCGKTYKVANRAAGELLNKQDAEIQSLTREINERREWEAEIKEKHDLLCKMLTEEGAENSRIYDMLFEAYHELHAKDDRFDEASDEIDRLSEEIDSLSELYDNARVEIVSAEGQIGHLEAELAKKRKCTCKAKKGKFK